MKKRVSHENNDTIIQRNESKEDHVLDEEVQFVPPAKGTPAAQALQGIDE
jgi:hypothetical protein